MAARPQVASGYSYGPAPTAGHAGGGERIPSGGTPGYPPEDLGLAGSSKGGSGRASGRKAAAKSGLGAALKPNEFMGSGV